MGDFLRVVSGSAGHRPRTEPQGMGGIAHDGLKFFVSQSRMGHHRIAETESRLVEPADIRGFGSNPAEQIDNFALVEVAQFKTQRRSSRNHVVSARLGPDPAHGSDLAAGNAGYDGVDPVDESGGGKQCVAALIHRSRARMVGEPLDGHFGMKNSNNALDHADVDFLLLQRAALFDVKFKIAGNASGFAHRLREPADIAADTAGSRADGLAALRHQPQNLFVETEADGMAAHRSALFVLKDDDFQRMPELNALLPEDLRNFNRGHRAHVAVVIPAFGHGIDVGTDQDRLQRRIGSGPPPDEIAGEIGTDLEPCLAHQLQRVLSRLEIGLTVSHPAYSALRILSEL